MIEESSKEDSMSLYTVKFLTIVDSEVCPSIRRISTFYEGL